MTKPKTVEDLLPLIARLPPVERARLLRLVAASPGVGSAVAYSAMPPRAGEFVVDDEPLAWDANGWEDVR